MGFLRQRLSYANVMATLAFFLALSGGAYAISIPRNSVGPKQLRKNAVTNVKIKKGSLSIDRFSKKAQQSLKVAGAKGDTGATGPAGLARAYGHVVSGVLDTARDSRGIVSARASGAYSCVKLDSSIDASKVSPIVSNDFPSGFVFSGNVAIGISQPFVDASSSVCGQPNEVGVASDSFRTDGTGSYGIGPGDFFILIP
jgi:hypothetical protein